VWERFTHSVDGSEKLKLIKVEGIGFPKDHENDDNLDERAAHFKKFEVGTVIGVYDFLSDPDYYTKMYSIVHRKEDYVTNV
tara:strand:+ start:587 stop:829 length:243 start_codon:yes stop_codon:yes gene_type:complete